MRMKLWMACLAAGLAIATTVEAQPGGGGGGGRRGGGGFGGFGGRGGIFSLAANEAVQKELTLSSDEAAKVKTVSDDYGTAMRESMSSGGQPDFQNMSQEERTKMMEKMSDTRKTLTAKYLPDLKAALTADQFTRLQQINWQNLGTAAYGDTEVVKSLTITKDQTEKISQINDEYGVKTRDLFTPGQPPDFGKMQELNKEKDSKINDVLTKEQLDKFATLKGKEFDVSQLRPQFGRGGGGGGGNGGGGGGRPKRPQAKSE